MYAQDNGGMLPRAMIDLKSYVDEPFDPDAYALVVFGRLTDIENPGETVLIRRRKLLRDGSRAVALADGHAESVSLCVRMRETISCQELQERARR